tara:strand:- start:23 stop:265 length:243 start_codon:yes stop_codon:yes gene_type:complete
VIYVFAAARNLPRDHAVLNKSWTFYLPVFLTVLVWTHPLLPHHHPQPLRVSWSFPVMDLAGALRLAGALDLAGVPLVSAR